jgi:hypothetical protein
VTRAGLAAAVGVARVQGLPAGDPELAWFDRARALEGAVWTLGMAHQYPARYAEWARTLLANVLGRTMGI